LKVFRVHTSTGYVDVRANSAAEARLMVQAPGVFIKKVKVLHEES